ncbi:cupin domain-containing protein [Cupriavidus sp. amp6]|uniref:cupin domain-containing protein n=1 Tax=Cupriavidus sp. amp6 TaxID=388051 RepID=UPI000424BA33|nr:cupin domain-containing protein [Cupriavidus sp. amp6]
MNVITATSNWYWSPATAAAGHAISTGLIGPEYTDAYSLGLARIEPGGSIPARASVRNQAYFVMDGEGVALCAGAGREISRGSLVKVPCGVAIELRNSGASPLWLLTICDPAPEPRAGAGELQSARQLSEAEVLSAESFAWKAFEATGVQGYELKPTIVGDELTQAYSVDLMRVAPGGYSEAHTDLGRHAFVILEGVGQVIIDGQTFCFQHGDIVKVPPGSLHELRNHGENSLVFLTIYDPPRRRKTS